MYPIYMQSFVDGLNQNVITVAHNRRTFDFPVIISAVENSDSISVFQEFLVGLWNHYRYPDQSHLTKNLLRFNYGALSGAVNQPFVWFDRTELMVVSISPASQ